MSYLPKVFDTLVANVDKLRTGVKKNALTFLKSNAKVFLDKKLATVPPTEGDAKRLWPSEKKLWEQCHNLVVSFIEGLESNDVDVKDIKTLVKDLRSAEKAHEERIYKLKEADEKRKTTNQGEFEMNPTRSEKYDPGAGAEAIFHKYSLFKSRMDVQTNKQFIAIRMPVTVILGGGIPDPIKLRRTGLCDDLLFGYPIIKNQVLIGLNPAFVQKYREGWSKYQKEVKNNVGVKTKLDADWQRISDEFTAMMKERYGRNYVMMGNPHAHGHLIWMWMAESRDLQRLNGTTGTSTFAVQDWVPPFEADKLKPAKVK